MSKTDSLPLTIRSSEVLGATLAIRRYELGMTQTQVAELAEVSIRSLKQLEAGQTNAGIQAVLRVLYVLGLEFTIGTRTTI
ncbi:hypothetical protein GCM10022408_11950 [Hymenobacter fastidiosus]|uniref:HTH cro/C1-type domain-containing protein n=1 Tax=Hymenobacter fastidiosus TaxID=486264 RepID=A0ABP7RU60_9BACT